MNRSLLIAATALALTMAADGAVASPLNLVTNGYFDQTTNGQGAYYTGTSSAPAGSTYATGWNACSTTTCNSADGGYPFLFIATPGIAVGAATNATNGFADPWDDAAGHGNSAQGTAYRAVWGANNGGVGQDGLAADAFNGYGPLGRTDPHNFLIADGDYHRTAIGQTINNLIVGDHYSVVFDWAATQWSKNTGPTTEQWQVMFGNAAMSTPIFHLNSKSFSGWMEATMNFTATSQSQALSFLALGTPTGAPPMLLLDDVQLYDTPEPAALAVLVVGLGCVGVAARRRRITG